MSKCLAIFAVVVVIIAGCAGMDEETERRREAFRLPKYSGTQEPTLNRAGLLLSAAMRYNMQATAATNPLEKKRLLLESAKNYEAAIEELKALRARTKDARRREDLSLVILQARSELQDTLKSIPITGE